MRTVPVNHSAGPLPDGCEPFLLMSRVNSCRLVGGASARARMIAGKASTAVPTILRKSRRTVSAQSKGCEPHSEQPRHGYHRAALAETLGNETCLQRVEILVTCSRESITVSRS